MFVRPTVVPTPTLTHSFLLACAGSRPSSLPSELFVPLFDIRIGEVIGSGGFGDVVQAECKGRQVALKFVDLKAQVPDALDSFKKQVVDLWYHCERVCERANVRGRCECARVRECLRRCTRSAKMHNATMNQRARC